MKLVFASDSFKGTLTSERIIELLKKASKEVFGECRTVPVVLADGGEGRVDVQSSSGKALQRVGERALRAGIPCIAICGSTAEGYEKIFEPGITRIETLVKDDITPEYAMDHAEEVYYQRALEVFKAMKVKPD